jgi:AcrR family transcriptional regulator
MARIARSPNDTPIPRKILIAALRQFGKSGYEASMQEIARDAGVTAAALYYHYKDKRELLFKCLEWMALTLHEACRPAAAIKDPEKALTAFVSNYISYQIKEFAFVSPMYASLVHGTRNQQDRLTSKQRKALLELEHRTLDVLRTIIDSGKAQRVFKVENPKLTAFAIIGMSEHTLNWVKPGGEMDADSIADYYARLATRIVGSTR